MSRDVRNPEALRDKTFSDRHRNYGSNVPFTDVDCLRYNRGHPVALEEWKYGPKISRAAVAAALRDNPNLLATRRLADAAATPFVVTRFMPGETGWEFDVIPANSNATAFLSTATLMSERVYIEFIHHLGGHQVDRGVERWLERNGIR